MCGIAGFSLSPNDPYNARTIANALILGIEERGKDSTGMAWRDSSGGVIVQKSAVPASHFVKQSSIWKGATTAILHTRAATQGTPNVRANNHPISTGGITGVHNGMLWNDHSIFTRMKIEANRIGEVDSEAIFAALAYGGDIIGYSETKMANGEIKQTPEYRLANDMLSILEEIEGSAAIAWMDDQDADPTILHLARLTSNPIVWAQTSGGSFFFASTAGAVNKMATAAGIDKFAAGGSLKDGEYLRVRSGIIEECLDFSPNYGGYTYSSYGTSTLQHRPAMAYGWADDLDRYDDLDGGTYGRILTAAPDPDDTTTLATEQAEMLHNSTRVTGWLDISLLISPTQRGYVRRDSLAHHSRYAGREQMIEDWIERKNDSNEPDESMLTLLVNSHALLRVGDYVTTDFGGGSAVGQVVEMPKYFPGGVYTIVLFVSNRDRSRSFERVLVQRFAHEFHKVGDGPDNDAEMGDIVNELEAANA